MAQAVRGLGAHRAIRQHDAYDPTEREREQTREQDTCCEHAGVPNTLCWSQDGEPCAQGRAPIGGLPLLRRMATPRRPAYSLPVSTRVWMTRCALPGSPRHANKRLCKARTQREYHKESE